MNNSRITDTPVRDPLGSSFHWLNWTQFQGALNDNIFKLLVAFYLISKMGEDKAAMLNGLAGIIFALPFILFVPAAGVLADRFSKSRITVTAKVAEIAVMVTGCLVFLYGHPWMGFLILFLMSAQSAFFGPTKYGIVPELVTSRQLSRANGYLVALTYLSIILGTVAAPWLTDTIVGTESRGDLFALAASVCVLIAITGTLTSLRIGYTPAAGSNATISWRFWNDVIRTYHNNKQDRFLVLAILAAAYFSLIGAFIQMNLIAFAIDHLHLSKTAGGYLFLFAAIGIGAGSLLAGKLSGRNIEFGIIPVGAILIASASCLLFILPYSVNTTRIMLFVAGLGAGLYIIPLDAFIQHRAPRDQIGAVMAANGFLSWIGVFAAGFLVSGFSLIPFWQPAYTFGLLGLLTLGMTIACLVILPDFFARFIAMVLTRSVYRIRKIGMEHLPTEGGALLVANHVSYMDALIILACQQRRIRFLMERSIYEGHGLQFIFKLMGVIPISENDNPRELVGALQKAREAMDQGFMVCIFAEGALTRNGHMRGFKPGLERIVKGTNYPIIPLYLGGVWGSRFSHYRTVFRGDKAPIKWRYPVTLVIGAPLPTATKAWQVQQSIQELAAIHFDVKRNAGRSVGRQFIRAARSFWFRPAISDTSGTSLTYGKTLIAALALASHFRRTLKSETNIGVVLPPSVGGTLINLGLALAGKVPINLNFTASPDAFTSSLKQADIRTIISAKIMVSKISHIDWPDGVVYAEEILKSMSMASKIAALIKAVLIPSALLVPRVKQQGDDLLTIMFSSGTTGEPKGVMLSHHNILSNVEQITEVFRPDRDAHLCAALPIFHSFGFTAGIFFPLLMGLRVSYHVSPLDAGKIVEVIKNRQCNTLFTTPSFLSSYHRKADPEELKSLKFVLVGAEKLKSQLADAFAEKFGVRPLEGYGTTEMSPVVALNLPDPEQGTTNQINRKDGSIGQPLPGIAAKVVDVETNAVLPPDQSGMLMVRGPNRMLGYLNRPDLTEKACPDEWYITGDIAKIDRDGFIFITDRLFRFSKIAGEMVPHMAIEEVLVNALKLVEMSIAITSVPDERKGERLVLLYTEAIGEPEALRRILNESTLPNLWRPSESMYFKVEKLPMTSTGKMDVRMLRQIAYTCVYK